MVRLIINSEAMERQTIQIPCPACNEAFDSAKTYTDHIKYFILPYYARQIS